MAFFIAIQKWF